MAPFHVHSGGARHDYFYPQKKSQSLGFREQDEPFVTHAVVSSLCLPPAGQLPYPSEKLNGGSISRETWPIPSDIYPTKKKKKNVRIGYSPSVFSCANPVLITHTWLVFSNGRHFGDPVEKGRHWWFVNIKDSATGSKRAMFFERLPLTPAGIWRCVFSYFVVVQSFNAVRYYISQ